MFVLFTLAYFFLLLASYSHNKVASHLPVYAEPPSPREWLIFNILGGPATTITILSVLTAA